MENWIKRNQDRLDWADYWASATWRQLSPIHLESTDHRLNDVRIAPWLTDRAVAEYPNPDCCPWPTKYWCRHYAVRQGHHVSWDAVNCWAGPKKVEEHLTD